MHRFWKRTESIKCLSVPFWHARHASACAHAAMALTLQQGCLQMQVKLSVLSQHSPSVNPVHSLRCVPSTPAVLQVMISHRVSRVLRNFLKHAARRRWRFFRKSPVPLPLTKQRKALCTTSPSTGRKRARHAFIRFLTQPVSLCITGIMLTRDRSSLPVH